MPPTELSDQCIIWCGLNADVACNDFVAGSDVHYHALPDKYILDSKRNAYLSLLS